MSIHICKTNKATAESEMDQLRKHIIDMTGKNKSERRLWQIYTVAHRAFINDGLEAVNEHQD